MGLQPGSDNAVKITNVTGALRPTNSQTDTQTVVSGQADGRYDATWFATNRYLAMSPGALAKLDGSAQTMASPVILGVRPAVAHRLGWDNKPVSWSDITTAVAAHQFNFGMSDPKYSNSGLSALVGVATAVAGDGAALQPSGATQASPHLREFFGGQALKASLPSLLADDYVRAQGSDYQGTHVDGIIDYESVLLSLNASGKLREPLQLIYPSDGVVTADYTLSLLASAPPAAKYAYTRLVGYLRTHEPQRQIMQQTRRRPTIPEVHLGTDFGRRQTFEVPFPGTLDVVNDLIDAYDGTVTIYKYDPNDPIRLQAVTSPLEMRNDSGYELDYRGSGGGISLALLRGGISVALGSLKIPFGLPESATLDVYQQGSFLYAGIGSDILLRYEDPLPLGSHSGARLASSRVNRMLHSFEVPYTRAE